MENSCNQQWKGNNVFIGATASLYEKNTQKKFFLKTRNTSIHSEAPARSKTSESMVDIIIQLPSETSAWKAHRHRAKA